MPALPGRDISGSAGRGLQDRFNSPGDSASPAATEHLVLEMKRRPQRWNARGARSPPLLSLLIRPHKQHTKNSNQFSCNDLGSSAGLHRTALWPPMSPMSFPLRRFRGIFSSSSCLGELSKASHFNHFHSEIAPEPSCHMYSGIPRAAGMLMARSQCPKQPYPSGCLAGKMPPETGSEKTEEVMIFQALTSYRLSVRTSLLWPPKQPLAPSPSEC